MRAVNKIVRKNKCVENEKVGVLLCEELGLGVKDIIRHVLKHWKSIIGIDGRMGTNEIQNNSKLDAMKNLHLSMVANFYGLSTWDPEARGLPLLTAE